jgi:hypothetical protein
MQLKLKLTVVAKEEVIKPVLEWGGPPASWRVKFHAAGMSGDLVLHLNRDRADCFALGDKGEAVVDFQGMTEGPVVVVDRSEK